MKKEKRYQTLRLGVMKKLNQNQPTQSIQGSHRGYDYRMTKSLPLLGNHHRHDPWVIWLKSKIAFNEWD